MCVGGRGEEGVCGMGGGGVWEGGEERVCGRDNSFQCGLACIEECVQF